MRKGSSDGQWFLGEFEHMVLLAILQAGTQAYAIRILDELDSRADRRTDRGALYTTLARLESKGYLDVVVEPGTPARGGHRRRVFSVRPEGLEALRVARQALNNLSRGLGPLLARHAK
jgi:DNA-binding PadR family transcriptional regulator